MHERFTDRARKVMQMANQEAQRFNHEYIGTEHILLGLIKEGSGVAANVLKNLDIDLCKVHLEVEKIICPGSGQVTTGKLPTTPWAKKVIEYAIEEAHNLNHRYVGTEHLLLGLIRTEEGVASRVLMNLGLRLPDIRKEVLQLLGYKIESEEKSSGATVYLSRPLMCDSRRETTAEPERIRSLEQQLWNVRVMLGALTGAIAGALIAASIGSVLGLILGGGMAALGRRILAALAGSITGVLLACTHLPSDGGRIGGALLGALVGFLIAEIGGPSGRRRFSDLGRR